MSVEGTVGGRVAYDGRLFRVEQMDVPGKSHPYEFVRRVGATVVIAVTDVNSAPHVLVARTTRLHYGVSKDGLPGGNADGRFAVPEHPTTTGLRELREETGYGYDPGVAPNIDTFTMRPVSTTILYNRSISVVRNVAYVGGELNDPSEIVEVAPTPLEEFMEPIFGLRQGGVYPEINLAFGKAEREVGREQVLDWMVNGGGSPHAGAVIGSFDPWMHPAAPQPGQ